MHIQRKKFLTILFSLGIIATIFPSTAFSLDSTQCQALSNKIILNNECLPTAVGEELDLALVKGYCGYHLPGIWNLIIDNSPYSGTRSEEELRTCFRQGEPCITAISQFIHQRFDFLALPFLSPSPVTQCGSDRLAKGYTTETLRQEFYAFCVNLSNYNLSDSIEANHNYFTKYCPFCGNAKKEGAELCDLGLVNGLPGYTCSANCTIIFQPSQFQLLKPKGVCGNGILEESESCDDGNTVNGDCCSSSCQNESAGTQCNDGITLTVNDVCDGAGHCKGTSSLQLQVCGNGKIEGTEQCDAGLKNGIIGSGCTKDCKKTSLTPTFPTLSR